MSLSASVTHYTQSIFLDNIAGKIFLAVITFLVNLVVGDGALNGFLSVVFLLFTLDFITWAWRSAKKSDFSSRGLRQWASKFTYYIIVITVARSVDIVWGLPIATSFILTFLLFSDAISILENFHELGFNVPIGLIKFLKIKKREVENKFIADIGETLDDMLWTKDENNKFLWLNNAIAHKLLRVKNFRDAIGKRAVDFTSNKFGELCENSDEITKTNFVEKGQPKTRFIEWETFENGVELWLDVYKQVITDENNEIIWTTGSARDITDILPEEVKAKFRAGQSIQVPLNYNYN